MKEVKSALGFMSSAQGFGPADKLKLALFLLKAKPCTYVILKITPDNLDEKAHFEQHLNELGILFDVSRPKSFEEISSIKGDVVHWKIKGTWHGYDLFSSAEVKRQFKNYVQAVRKQQQVLADRLGGELYGYSSCCVEQYTKDHNIGHLRKNYSYCEFYTKLHDVERKFPFLTHTACSSSCAKSRSLNEKYSKLLKKNAPAFFKEFTAKKQHSSPVIVDGESDIFDDKFSGILGGKSIWPVKDCHEYGVIAAKQYENHYYLYSYLTKQSYEHGTIVPAKITMQFNYADMELGKPVKIIAGIRHQRQFALLGREY